MGTAGDGTRDTQGDRTMGTLGEGTGGTQGEGTKGTLVRFSYSWPKFKDNFKVDADVMGYGYKILYNNMHMRYADF